MSNNFFPALPGIAWDNVRTPVWQTRRQQSVSGKVTTMADWASPLYKWQLTFDFLRSNPTYGEMQTLMAFYNQLQGGYDTFLYIDPDDNAVTNEQINTGDGATTTFRLIRAFGGYVDPVWSANMGVVRVGGTARSDVSISADLSSIIFATPPAAGAAIVASFTCAWRCRFSDDTIDFNNFMSQLYEVKQLNFESIK
jgi:uncharacterized protein (TIGR02217 family)